MSYHAVDSGEPPVAPDRPRENRPIGTTATGERRSPVVDASRVDDGHEEP